MKEVGHDAGGIEIAAGELLREDMMAHHRERIEQQMSGGSRYQIEDALAAARVERTVADGYYAWAMHLFMVEQDITVSGRDAARLQAIELLGLAAIARARRSFDRDHPQCPNCRLRLLFADAHTCERCGAELKRKAA